MARPKRKRTAAEKRARRERKQKFMTIFINGKQKRVPRPPMIDGIPVDEFIARTTDPIWLHQNEMWEPLTPCDETRVSTDSQSPPEVSRRMEIQKGQDFPGARQLVRGKTRNAQDGGRFPVDPLLGE